jgi:hypothetical protein
VPSTIKVTYPVETAIGMLIIHHSRPIVGGVLLEPTGGASRQAEEVIGMLHRDIEAGKSSQSAEVGVDRMGYSPILRLSTFKVQA